MWIVLILTVFCLQVVTGYVGPTFTTEVKKQNLLLAVRAFIDVESGILNGGVQECKYTGMNKILLAIAKHFPNIDTDYLDLKNELITLAAHFYVAPGTWRGTSDQERRQLKKIIEKTSETLSEKYLVDNLIYEDLVSTGYQPAVRHLLHSLTFNQNKNDPNGDGTELLGAITAYATGVTRCSDCSDHYKKITSKITTTTFNTKDVCMLLWKLHNIVTHNVLLISEERSYGLPPPASKTDLPWIEELTPLYFPVESLAPKCYKNGKPDNEELFLFLFNMYTNYV